MDTPRQPPRLPFPRSWSWTPSPSWSPAAVSQWEAFVGLVFGWRHSPERLAYGVVFLGALRGFLIFARQFDGGAEAEAMRMAAWTPLEHFDAPRAWGAAGVLFTAGDVLAGFASLPTEEREVLYERALQFVDHTLGQVSTR